MRAATAEPRPPRSSATPHRKRAHPVPPPVHRAAEAPCARRIAACSPTEPSRARRVRSVLAPNHARFSPCKTQGATRPQARTHRTLGPPSRRHAASGRRNSAWMSASVPWGGSGARRLEGLPLGTSKTHLGLRRSRFIPTPPAGARVIGYISPDPVLMTQLGLCGSHRPGTRSVSTT